jgi:tetratricopeptide (TPR) repeat protein
MDLRTANLLETLSENVLDLSRAGRWDEALTFTDSSVDKARSSSNGEIHEIIYLAGALEIKADLLRKQDFLDDARVIYLEALEMLRGVLKDASECTEMFARISASIGVLYDFVQDDDEAILYYERAIEMYEKLNPPDLEEIAAICNNLGFIYRSMGNMDEAETLYLKSLEICHDLYGKHHERTSVLFNNLGSLYLKAGYDQQAFEMHTMALAGRLEYLGKDHPETAQSYSNLALSNAQLGDKVQAKELFKKSLAIWEEYISSVPDEYLAVAKDYAEFLNSTGDADGSREVIKITQMKLAKL